ncbi:MAG: hypothetical protein CME26_17675 [Gemmatimonadetes bacterium]|nr:hypothetical protein [Gemmatimonadota bacterium]
MDRIERIKRLAIDGALTSLEALAERKAAENEVTATKQHISKIEGEIAAYDLERESLDNLEKLIESYRWRLKLYERKDHTDLQPSKHLRRQALLDFLGDGCVVVTMPRPGWVELVAEPVFDVPVGDGGEAQATYRIQLRTEHRTSTA